MCVFITAVPIRKLFARGEGDSGGHVLRETTSRGLCGLVCPSRTRWSSHAVEKGCCSHCRFSYHHLRHVDRFERSKNSPRLRSVSTCFTTVFISQHIDISSCSKMLNPVNIQQKYWFLACIDFDNKTDFVVRFSRVKDNHSQKSNTEGDARGRHRHGCHTCLLHRQCRSK